MAKDPAFLFYPGDYITGTLHLDFECKGAYVDLLMLQFNKEHITIHMIKHILGDKFNHIWPQISEKFKTDGTLYWNERLRNEREKRVKYSESRRSNRKKEKETKTHMYDHMENENINSIKRGVIGEKNKRAEKIDQEKQIAIFPGGVIQELGPEQKRSLKEGTLEPHYIRFGKIE